MSLTLPIGEAETATAYASRLVALNGSRYAQNFVQDMGLSWRDVCAGESDAIGDLAALAGVDPRDLSRFALRIAEGKRRLVGREAIHIKLLRHRRQHVCALCVLEAPRVGGAPPSGFPMGWQVEAVRSCPVHRVELTELPMAEDPRSIFDLAGRIEDHRALIERGGRAVRPVPERGLERYLVGRLHRHGHRRGGGHVRDASWLDGLGFGTVVRACESLGLVLAHGPHRQAVAPAALGRRGGGLRGRPGRLPSLRR